ncbi:MAG: AAA family ATPase, partial [Bacteroidota bacterium]
MIFSESKRIDIVKASLSDILEIILLDIQEKNYYFELETKLDEIVKNNINNKNKKFFIEEKIKVLKKELNEDEYIQNKLMFTMEEYNSLKEHIRNVIDEELKKLKSAVGAEKHLILDHLNWIKEVFVLTKIKREIKIEKIKKILDENHIGSASAKKEFIESLNIRNPDESESIIILHGPPGTGKTAFAKMYFETIFETKPGTNKYYEVNVGGQSDSSYFLGHSRTYLGATPGLLAYIFKYLKCSNGGVIFDEFDKMNKDSGKNPYNVFCRILDPNQNNSFKDNYLEVPLDLSELTFILCVNDLTQIPSVILDRAIIIKFDGYSIYEKELISKNLLKKTMEIYKLEQKEIDFPDKFMRQIIISNTY